MAPREIKQMTMWEYMACVSGFNRAQGGGNAHQGAPMSDEEYDALCALGEGWSNGGS
ncbi:MAG: hypothetical protein ABNH17_05545 [Paracoccus sp. (in: a-proteobacteria)]